MDHPHDIDALVRSAAAGALDTQRLASLTRRCWPSASETTQPAARTWLRRWRPDSILAPTAQCSCATGSCGWCN